MGLCLKRNILKIDNYRVVLIFMLTSLLNIRHFKWLWSSPTFHQSKETWKKIIKSFFFLGQLAGGVILGVALWLRHDSQTSNLLILQFEGHQAPGTFYISEYTAPTVELHNHFQRLKTIKSGSFFISTELMWICIFELVITNFCKSSFFTVQWQFNV